MRIGILPVDSRHPNYALMKVSSFYKAQGAEVEFYTPFGRYDKVFMSKIFTFTPDWPHPVVNADEVERGGTGYDLAKTLPAGIEASQPDYDLYGLDRRSALGFLTRGCVRRCPWCVVPRKEGGLTPYRDIEEVAVDGRDRVTLQDNNILASAYGLAQIEKIARLGLRVDFNQGLDARLIDDETAALLARVRWLRYIRMACDTSAQVAPVRDAAARLRRHGYRGDIFVYCLLSGDIGETLARVRELAAMDRRVVPFGQPYRDLGGRSEPPQWQKDMAHWMNKRSVFRAVGFEDFSPRRGFRCGAYLSAP